MAAINFLRDINASFRRISRIITESDYSVPRAFDVILQISNQMTHETQSVITASERTFDYYAIAHSHEYGNSCYLVKSNSTPSEQDAVNFINEHGGGYDEHLGESIDVFGPFLANEVPWL